MRERAFVLSRLNQALVEFQFGEPTEAEIAAMKQTLKDDHFKYFVLAITATRRSRSAGRSCPPSIDERRREFLTETLGAAIIYCDERRLSGRPILVMSAPESA